MNKSNLGLKIKILRKHKKWSQAKLAEFVDMSDTAISNIETGKYFPRVDNLIAISNALDTSVSFLISDDDINAMCLNEIRKYLLILDERIADHVVNYIVMCSGLCDKLNDAKIIRGWILVGIKISHNNHIFRLFVVLIMRCYTYG